MLLIEITGLLLKVLFRLLVDYPKSFRFLEDRMQFHHKKNLSTGHFTAEAQRRRGFIFFQSKISAPLRLCGKTTTIDSSGFSNFNQKKLKLYCRVATIGIACLEHLNNKKATDQQKKSMLIGCAIAPIIDDLMDEKGYSANEINRIIQKHFQRDNTAEHIAIGLLEDLDGFAPGLRQSEIWDSAINSQIRSNQQNDKGSTTETLTALSFDKGGNGLLVAMLAAFPELISTKNAQLAFYKVGALIQFVDDIFDVWTDREEGQQTLVTNCVDMNELSVFFDRTVAETNELLLDMPLKKSRIAAFIFELKCYTSLGRLALDRFILLQNKSGGGFRLADHGRKELVTDMAQIVNRINYIGLVLF